MFDRIKFVFDFFLFKARNYEIIIYCHTSLHHSETFRTISSQEVPILKFRLSSLRYTKSQFFSLCLAKTSHRFFFLISFHYNYLFTTQLME